MDKSVESSICFIRVKELLEFTINKLNVDCTTLLGREFSISNSIYRINTFNDFFSGNNHELFLISSELQDSYDGYIFTVMQKSDMIKIAGVMLQHEDTQTVEMIKEDQIDKECADSIQVFSSQLTGTIGSVFRRKLSKPVHTKLSLNTPILKGNESILFSGVFDYEYIQVESIITIKGFGTGTFNMFIPVDVVEDFFDEPLYDKSTNVLIVDDSKTDIKVMKKFLTDTEFRVYSAVNATDAFAILYRKKIRLIILDLIMPELNGIEVCRQIKNTPRTRGIPIIFISARPTEAAIIEAINLGASDFLVKPISKKVLLERLEKYIIKKTPPKLY